MTHTDSNHDLFPEAHTSGAQSSYAASPDHKVTRTGASEILIILTGFFIILLLIVIFIMQNQTSANITFLWMHGSIPLALAIILSVIIGALLMALAAGARVLQLRHTASRHRKQDTAASANRV